MELGVALEGDLLMDKLWKYFAIASVAFLIVLAVSPFKDFFREWKGYQIKYNRLITELPQRVRPATIGIKQIWVEKLDRVDRCVTCHLGVKEPALTSAPEPFRTHPQIYHDVEEFGCTMCHEGQGAATEYMESIGKVKYLDKPILPRAYMEASCAKCHKERDVPQAPILNFGRRLIEESNCIGCHKLDGYQKQWVPGLDGIGTKVDRTWLVSWLKNPKGYYSGTRMPNFLLTDEEANTLADFLLSFKSLPGGEALEPLPPQLISANDAQKARLADLGSTRFREARCISCHPVNRKGGYVATELGKVASKVSVQWLYNYVRNPKRFLPGVQMPRYRLKEDELVGIVAYMQSEFIDYDKEQLPPHTPDPAYYEKGLALFKKYNCAGCHRLSVVSREEEMGPELTAIGSKKIYEIEFGTSDIEQTLPSYLRTKLLNPRVFATSLRMPRYEFTEKEAEAITVALLGNTGERTPDEFVVHSAPPSTYAPQGEFGNLVDDLACLGCHKMTGRGRLVATDLSLEASQAQSKWIEGYFKIPYSLRPTLTERMPNLFLTDGEIRTIVDYMEKVFIADSLERTVPSDAATAGKGKGLYFERYACQSCHQIGGSGGYVGPPLDKVGTRLKPGWVFYWLKNPQVFKPTTLEPNNNLSVADAEALTAYLMTLK
jgi:mono/diheme cytochrome c family protein